MARMKILSLQEEEAFESPPMFSSNERQKYFDFPAAVYDIAETLRIPTNEVCFLVMLGYFKTTNKFYKRSFYNGPINSDTKMESIKVDRIWSK